MNNKYLNYIFIVFLFVFVSCRDDVISDIRRNDIPSIFPDYTGVMIPFNIAPLNFSLEEPHKKALAVLSVDDYVVKVKAKKGKFIIPISQWKKLLSRSKGQSIAITIHAKNEEWVTFDSFNIYVAQEPVDSYLAYRLIEPVYNMWNRMGIYQRNLETYLESAIVENKLSGFNCINCHSFCMQEPDKMLFHMRDLFPGTILVDSDKVEKLDTKTPQTISSLVYPSWHPSGKYVAFSVNETMQAFHMNDKNRIEVYDEASDVVVYDVEKYNIITTGKIFSKDAFETFPTFSPDGKTLYFCSADVRAMPVEYDQVKYSLCSISFDPETQSFGSTVDTLYNATVENKSVSFPRVSPDGKFLLYTISGYGNFSIWHKDADLNMINLQTKEHYPLDILNSDDTESYHSWSHNSRWVVFSSRRMDGLYTRPYIAYIDEQGRAFKPFLLPQKDAGFYNTFMKSYNIPEFITDKVKNRSRVFMDTKNENGRSVTFSMK